MICLYLDGSVAFLYILLSVLIFLVKLNIVIIEIKFLIEGKIHEDTSYK